MNQPLILSPSPMSRLEQRDICRTYSSVLPNKAGCGPCHCRLLGVKRTSARAPEMSRMTQSGHRRTQIFAVQIYIRPPDSMPEALSPIGAVPSSLGFLTKAASVGAASLLKALLLGHCGPQPMHRGASTCGFSCKLGIASRGQTLAYRG